MSKKINNLSDLITAYKSETLEQLLHACAVYSTCWADYRSKAVQFTSDEAAIEAAWSKFYDYRW